MRDAYILPSSLILREADFIKTNLEIFPITFERLSLLKGLTFIKTHLNMNQKLLFISIFPLLMTIVTESKPSKNQSKFGKLDFIPL